MTAVLPIVDFIKIDTNDLPYLAGSECKSCGYIYVGKRQNCAKCFARDAMADVHLAETGKVYTWTIVNRSFPGVQTPFIDAIVDLDDGSHIKGTLLNVEPDPEAIGFGMPVKVIFRPIVPVGTTEPYLAYFFEPT